MVKIELALSIRRALTAMFLAGVILALSAITLNASAHSAFLLATQPRVMNSQTYPVGAYPIGVAFDGSNVWVVNRTHDLNGGSVSVLRASDGLPIRTLPVGAQPHYIAFDGQNMWVTNRGDDTISVVRVADGFHVMTPTAGSGVAGIAFDGQAMWIANNASHTVSVVRATDGQVTATYSISDPWGVDFDGTKMWVADVGKGKVTAFQVSDGLPVMTTTVGSAPMVMAFDGANMWVVNGGSNTVNVVRASDGFLVMTPTVGNVSRGIAFDGQNMWITNYGAAVGNTVSVVRASDGVVVDTETVGNGPLGVAFDGDSAWVANSGSDSVTKVRLVYKVYLPIVMRWWPPIPYTPLMNALDNSDGNNGYTIYWAEQPEQLAETYTMQEATNSAFTTGLRTACATSQQSCTLNGQTPGTYYYRVRGQNTWGHGAWSNVQSVRVYPLFVGLNLQWDGNGYVRGSEYADIGYHLQQQLTDLTDADTVRNHNYEWYAPDPYGIGSDTWDSYYSLSTGYFKSSSSPGDPSWKWGNPWILPYDWQLWNGQTFALSGQAFLVSGPYSGYTAFGKPVQYWQLVNRDRFLIWDSGGDWKQYAHSGDITLRFDAGNSRLEIYSNILRRYYYRGQLTNDTVQYIIQLTAANSFPNMAITRGDLQQHTDDPARPTRSQYRADLQAGRLR